MLSYQHGYHAGNLADVHKHAALAWMLAYLTAKPKPISYIETHAGRGLYDLAAPAALKTGEAAAGIAVALARGWFAPDHPYAQALDTVRALHGAAAYPGSPMLAALAARPGDRLHLAELHPQEFAGLQEALAGSGADCRQTDGLALALALTPPAPRRGLLLLDPSYEVKSDYDTLPKLIGTVRRKWNVGVIVLWYPLLPSAAHRPMLASLRADHPDALCHEVGFPPRTDGRGMLGSGLFVINPPFGLADEAARLGGLYAALVQPGSR